MRIFWKISLIVLFLSLLLIIFFSLYIYDNTKKDFINDFKSSSVNQISQLDKFIDFFLENIKNDLNMLSTFPVLKKIDQTINSMIDENLPEKSIPEYDSEIGREILEIFKSYYHSHPSVTMVSLGTEYGGYIEYPFVELGRNYDPRNRPWYLSALNQNGEVVMTPPYITLFSQLPQIAAVTTVESENGDVLGVVSIDVTLESLTQLVEKTLTYRKGEFFMVDENGKIFASSEAKNILFENISSVNPLLKQYKNFNQYEVLRHNGHDYHVVTSKAEQANFYYIIASSDFEILSEMNERAWYVIGVALFVFIPLFLLIFLLSKNISKPLEHLSGCMREFASGNYGMRSAAKGSREIVYINDNFNSMADSLEKNIHEINHYNEELQCLNEELEKNNAELNSSYDKINEYTYRMEELISITSRICISAINRDHNFLKDLLEILMTFIGKADYGSISVIENMEWKFVWSIGHDIEGLKELNLLKDYLVFKDDGTQIVDTMEFNSNNIPKEIYEKLTEYTRPIKSSIVSNLIFNDRLIGSISLDIAKNSDKEFTQNELRMVSAFSNIASAFITMQTYMIEHGRFQKDLLSALIGLLEIHDPYTKGHSLNVANYSVLIAREMKLEQKLISRIYWAGMVHDIGKILIPSSILTKPSRLTEDEYEMIKNHPIWGARVLESFEALKDISSYVMHHHEKWDGSGYPAKISGNEIPLVSRIICVADSFDAMISDRPYRKKLSAREAFSEILKNSGTQFDCDIVKAFTEVFKNSDQLKKLLSAE